MTTYELIFFPEIVMGLIGISKNYAFFFFKGIMSLRMLSK